MTNTILFFGLSQNSDLIKYFKRFRSYLLLPTLPADKEPYRAFLLFFPP